jgi:hypothetical protein
MEKAQIRAIFSTCGVVVKVLREVIHSGVATMVHLVNDMGCSGEHDRVATHRLVLSTLEHVGNATVLARLTRLGNSEKRSIRDHIKRRTIGIGRRT